MEKTYTMMISLPLRYCAMGTIVVRYRKGTLDSGR